MRRSIAESPGDALLAPPSLAQAAASPAQDAWSPLDFDQEAFRAGAHEQSFRRFARQGVRLADCKLEGHPIHLFSPHSVLSAPHIVLAGDAAGVDPLLGEGISLALGYGELAARAVIKGLHHNNLDFADYTRDVHASPMGRSLRFRHRAASVIYRLQHPFLQRLVWWHLRPIMQNFIHRVVFNWARPDALPPTPMRRQLDADADADAAA